MSVSRLEMEQELRRAEEGRELEELRRAQEIRGEKEAPPARSVRVVHVLKSLGRTDFDDAADRVRSWWNGRQRVKRGAVTAAEMEALVRSIRGMGRGR